MKVQVWVVAALAAIGLTLAVDGADQQAAGDGPRFTADGQLLRPANYREWVYLSSGLGMTYGPIADAARNGNSMFDNVFVNPVAYKYFLRTGTWPDQTIFVLEARASLSKGSINNGGRYQSAVLGIESEVKDERRFPGKWAFFGFQGSAASAKMIPVTADCYSCHRDHGAVDNTFVQFYPTLLEVAKQKGTLKPEAEQKTPARTGAVPKAASSNVTDVVCGMAIDPKTAFGKTEYKGKTYYFCRQECKDAFEKAPEDYSKTAAND